MSSSPTRIIWFSRCPAKTPVVVAACGRLRDCTCEGATADGLNFTSSGDVGEADPAWLTAIAFGTEVGVSFAILGGSIPRVESPGAVDAAGATGRDVGGFKGPVVLCSGSGEVVFIGRTFAVGGTGWLAVAGMGGDVGRRGTPLVRRLLA